MLVINKCVSSPASYPDVSLSMKMCAQRKAGRRQPSVPFPWSLAVHHQSLAFRTCLYDVNNSVAIRPSDLGGGGTATAWDCLPDTRLRSVERVKMGWNRKNIAERRGGRFFFSFFPQCRAWCQANLSPVQIPIVCSFYSFDNLRNPDRLKLKFFCMALVLNLCKFPKFICLTDIEFEVI